MSMGLLYDEPEAVMLEGYEKTKRALKLDLHKAEKGQGGKVSGNLIG